jgi:hypothetical protein
VRENLGLIGRARHRPAAGVAAMAVAAGAAALALTGGVPAPAAAGSAVVRDPADFAVSLSSTRGSAESLWLMSAATGRRRLVARIGTGNGFALGPGGGSVFVVVGLVRSGRPEVIEIREVSVATHRIRFIADGAYPAVSPDGRYLAYATGPGFRRLAVRDLRTGRTRVLDVTGLIGRDATFLNPPGAVTWLGDGSQVVAMPQPGGSPSAQRPARAGPRAAGLQPVCGSGALNRQCLIVMATGKRRLAARRVFIRTYRQSPVTVLSGEAGTAHTLLACTDGLGVPGAVWGVRISGRRVSQTRLAPLPAGVLSQAIAPAGDRVLYLATSATPALWIARINRGRLTGQKKLYTDTTQTAFNEAAW